MENCCRSMWSNSHRAAMDILTKLKTHFKEEKIYEA